MYARPIIETFPSTTDWQTQPSLVVFVRLSNHEVKTKDRVCLITDTIPEELSVHMPYSAAMPAASVQLLLL